MSSNEKPTIQQAAKQGNPKAIALLLNRQLQPKGITAKVSAKDISFSIIVESIKTPPQLQLVSFVRQVFVSLGIDIWQTVKIYGRRIGEEFPDWHEDILIEHKPVLSLKDSAKQGDVKAISQLIHQVLPEGISVKCSIKEDCLQVMIESSETPDQQKMEVLLKTEVAKLEIQPVKKLRLYGKQTGEDFPDWHLDINLESTEEIVDEILIIKEANTINHIDGIELSNELYKILEEACYQNLAHRVSSEDEKNIHEIVKHFIDDLESDLKFDLEQFARQVNNLFKDFSITIEMSKIQSIISDITTGKFAKIKLAIRDLEKVSQQVLEVDFPEDSDQLTAFFRGAANEASAIFSGKTTLSKEAILGATIGSFVTPMLGTMIGGAIGAWFGNERQQQEINTIIEKYEKSRRKIFIEWESLLKIVYAQIAKLINEVSSIELITYEAIDKANDFCNEGNEFLNSEEGLLKAIELYDRAISLNPRLAIAWNNKGYVLNKLERYEEALIVLEKSIQINPDFIGAFNNYGDAFYGVGNYSEAMAAYDKCIEIDPENYEAWWNKGFCFAELEKAESAIQSFDKCIKIDDKHPNTWLINCIKAIWYIELNNFNKAIDSLTEAIRLNRSKAREYISQTEEFNCLTDDIRFQILIGLDSINCPRCSQSNPVSKYTDSINCSRCGCFINVASRQDEVSFSSVNSRKIFEQVQEIVSSQLGVNKAEIKSESSFANDLGADELDTVELIMALEEKYGIEIPDEDGERIYTVQNAVDYIENIIRI